MCFAGCVMDWIRTSTSANTGTGTGTGTCTVVARFGN